MNVGQVWKGQNGRAMQEREGKEKREVRFGIVYTIIGDIRPFVPPPQGLLG